MAPSADVITSPDNPLPAQMRAADGVGAAEAAASSVQLPSAAEADAQATQWLGAFQAALDTRNVDQVLQLFHDEAYWKDLLTLEWDHHAKHGKAAIKAWLEEDDRLNKRAIKNVKIEPGTAAALEALPGRVWIMAFYTFETAIARGRGCVRLEQLSPSAEWKAMLFYQGIEELIGHEEPSGPRRPKGVEHGQHRGRETWAERRAREQEYAADGHEPDVVVIGGGQGGLTVSARLKMLKVDALIIEKGDTVGSSWANRYKSLVLHDPVWYDHFPYKPFPAEWPVYTPKDKLVQWMRGYVEAMELNVWLRTTIQSATYDRAARKWTIQVDRDGTPRTLRPTYVILATGHSGEPNIPKFKGAEKFQGPMVHSSQHKTSAPFKGKNVVVVGCCNSGHDLAHEAWEQGANVTMVQRSETYIMSTDSIVQVLFADIYCENGPKVEDCDLMLNSLPNQVNFQLMTETTKKIARFDENLLAGLERAGFRLGWGPQNGGFLPLYFMRGGGYYLDVGASKLIADGEIKVKQGQEIDHLEEHEIIFADGSRLPADLIILATGYQNMKTTALRILGDELKDVKEVWGVDEEMELKTMWRDSGHPGFFFMGGNLALCRFMSKRLALRIKAGLEGIK